jgi:hydrogenase assembly chaperone HypC/HupF
VAVDGNVVTVELPGGRRQVDNRLVDPEVGDYVILYGGTAVEIVSEEDALETLALLEEMEAFVDA